MHHNLSKIIFPALKPALIFVFLPVLFSVSCSNSAQKQRFPSENLVQDVIRPLKLNPDTTYVFLQDYITDTLRIDSVSFSQGISSIRNGQKGYGLTLTYDNNTLPYYSLMKIWTGPFPYTLLLEKSDKIKYPFRFNPQNNAYQEIRMAGGFNDWNPAQTKLSLINGQWETNLTLDPGDYQYLIVADGVWMRDFNNPDSADNNMGGFNSVFTVKNSATEPLPVIYPAAQSENMLSFGVVNQASSVYVFWDNFLLEGEAISLSEGKLTVRIPEEAAQNSKSFIRVYAANASGKSNDLMIPLSGGRPLLSADSLTRAHKESQIYYFMLTDRFFNGNPDNDEPVQDARVAPAANFMGGDLIGITKKLKEGFFDSLNISTIWLSPVVQNPLKAYDEYPEPHRRFSGYHGYWPVHSTLVDHRFGSAECLHELVTEAHARGINVILDFVANHVHEDNPLIKNKPGWATEVNLPDGPNIRKWDQHRLTTWFDTFLPSLDFSQQEVIDTMTAIGLYWLKNFDLDGFRHDATKHIPLEFWRAMTLRLKKEVAQPENKTILQIGETFGSRALIGSYVGNGLLDGQFDFNLYFDARAVFALPGEPFTKITRSLDQSFKAYGANSLMGNITGNHDLPRFTSLASGDLSFSENAKDAAWNREIVITDTIGYTRMAQFMAFNMTIPGIPVIYYGDEMGMPGADDPDNRRMMKFNGLSKHENKLRQTVQTLTRLRKHALPLTYGHFEWLTATSNQMAYARKYFDMNAIIVFSKEPIGTNLSVNIPTHLQQGQYKAVFGTPFTLAQGRMQCNTPAGGFEVFVNFDF